MRLFTVSFLFLTLLTASRLSAQGNLVGFDWQHRPGNDPSWRSAPLDDHWRPLNVGISWERQDRPNGDAWLRTTFPAPPRFAATGLRLELKLPAASVEVFLNGRPIARTTTTAPTAALDLPGDALRWGEDNDLALRVLGHPWTGGAGQDQIAIIPRGVAGPVLAISNRVAPADHCFAANDEVAFDLTVTPSADSAAAVEVHALVVSDFHAVVRDIRVSRNGADRARPQHENLGRLAPGFYQVIAQATQGDYHAQTVFWLAVDPTKIACEAHPEPDLDDYWKRAKAELAAVPPAFRVERVPEKCTARHDVFSVEMASVEGVTLRAWYIVPKGARGPIPAVLAVPGYSAAMQPEWFEADDDIAWLALDIRGHGRSADVIHPGFGTPGFVGDRVLEPEHYVYKGAYLDCGRALEFLASRPEIDARRIAVAGGSQGGGLAYAVAALCPDLVAACVAGMPFLGDFADHQRIRGIYRTEMESYLPAGDHAAWSQLRRSMNLVDTACLAGRIRCPVLMGNGLFDDDCPPHIGFAVFNRIRAPKEFRLYPDEAHLLGARWSADSAAWLRRQFGLAPSA